MTLIHHTLTPDRAWGIWEITESPEKLLENLIPADVIPPVITNPAKISEFMAGRILTKALCDLMNLPYQGLIKNELGKPFLQGQSANISMSHSYPFVMVVIDRVHPVGIDIEHFKPKLLKIAGRVFHPDEVADAGNDLAKYTVYWCAKEALLKADGEKNLIFAENIRIEPFKLENRGQLKGHIIRNKKITTFSLYYQLTQHYAYVFTL